MNIDDALRQASNELRSQVDDVPVGDFEPNRSAAPLGAAVLVLIVALIAVAGWRATSQEEPVDVVTRPEVPTAVVEPSPAPAEPAPEPDQAETPDASIPLAPQVGQLTAASSGEFFVLSPGVSAWNRDESLLLAYRTGTGGPGHVVFDTATGEMVATVPLDPPDIEQVYWHPLIDETVIAFVGADLVAFDVRGGTTEVLHSFDGCESVDAGYPSPPSITGVLVGFCEGVGSQAVRFDLASGEEDRFSIDDDADAIQVSPSGTYVLTIAPDGLVQVRDVGVSGDGVSFELGGAVLTMITTELGDNAVVAHFDGDSIGSVVLVPLDGSPASVVVGPERGDEYPPSGTQISAMGDRVAFSTAGPVADELGGRIVSVTGFVDAADAATIVQTLPHGSEGLHDYWSRAFVSLSPTGRWIAYASDQGSDRVDLFVTGFDA